VALSLAHLLAELEKVRVAPGNEACADSYRQTLPAISRQLSTVPLVHGTPTRQGFESILLDGALRSRADLRSTLLPSEAYLGLHGGRVYTAAGVLYPDRDFAFVLSHQVERRAKASATPWDSGCFYKRLCPDLPAAPDQRRRTVFHERSLPAPEYRQYLVEYVASCFQSAQAYLRQETPTWPDPLRAMSSDPLSQVFEVRFEGRVPVDHTTVMAVFVTINGGGQLALDVDRALEPLRNQGVRIYEVSGAKRNLVWEVQKWMLNHTRAA